MIKHVNVRIYQGINGEIGLYYKSTPEKMMDHPTKAAQEQIHEVVWPLGKSAYSAYALKNRLADLNGKTIGELWDHVFRGEDIFPAIRTALKERFPDIRIIDYTHFDDIHGPHQREAIDKLPQLFRQYGCDAVISGIGA